MDSAIGLLRAGQLAAAEAQARELLARPGADAAAHALLAEVLRAAGRWREAADAQRGALAAKPDDAAGYRRLGEYLHRAGDVPGAIGALEQALGLEPDNARAASNLGALYVAAGDGARALPWLERAVALQPESAGAHNNLGLALARLGERERAAEHFMRAIGYAPAAADARLNLAQLLTDSGQPLVALALIRILRARDSAPKAPLCFVWAQAAAAAGRYDEALLAYRAALEAEPGHAPALAGLIRCLIYAGKATEALRQPRLTDDATALQRALGGLRALALVVVERDDEARRLAVAVLGARPDDPDAQVAQAELYRRAGDTARAVASYELACDTLPYDQVVLAGLSEVLAGWDDPAAEPARRRHERRLALAAQARLAAGERLLLDGQPDLAHDAFDAEVAAGSTDPRALTGLAEALFRLQRHERLLEVLERMQAQGIATDGFAEARFEACVQLCDWREHAAGVAMLTRIVEAGELQQGPVLTLLAQLDRPDLHRAAGAKLSAFGWPHEGAGPSRPAPFAARAGTRRRPRVAYLSADFIDHPVAYLMLPVFEAHDRNRFEFFALSSRPAGPGALRERMGRALEHLVDVSTDGLDDLARRIRALEIDVLVDLGGHTQYTRSLVQDLRPAPVQCTYLGYPATTGAASVDYLIGDPIVIPEGDERYYSEAIIRLPCCYLTGERPGILGAPTRADAGLPPDAIVYCAFNSTFKITPGIFDAWLAILAATPRSVLWLRGAPAAAQHNLRARAAAAGIDGARILFAARTKFSGEHHARFALADVFLDTSPYNAHTTAFEALCAGMPVVTLRGRGFAGRVASSLLHEVDLAALSCATIAEYVATAVRLGTQPAQLAALRQGLRDRLAAGTWPNPVRRARALEAAYGMALDRHQQGLPVASFSVPAGAIE